MKLSSLIAGSLLFIGLNSVSNKSLAPEIENYTGHTLEQLKEITHKKEKEDKKKFIINELTKPVLKFNIPVDTGQVSCVYGSRKVKGKWELHKGIDIGILGNAWLKYAERPDILPIAPGIVSFVGNKSGHGKMIEIIHADNLKSSYSHLNSFNVSQGDTVLSGQKIGEMGNGGNSRSDKKFGTGIHLHLQVERDGISFDPSTYFIGHKKIAIDDTLYGNILYSENKIILEENVNELETLVTIEDSARKNLVSKFSSFIRNFPLVEFINSKRKDTLGNLYGKEEVVISYGIQVAASPNKLTDKEIEDLQIKCGRKVEEEKMEVNGKMYHKYVIADKLSTIENIHSFIDHFEIKERMELTGDENLGLAVYTVINAGTPKEKAELNKIVWAY